MVSVVVGFFPDGCLRTLNMEGHAGSGEKGNDILCAALTILVRTALHTFANEDRLSVESRAEREGEAALAIRSCATGSRDWLKGITDYLLTGLHDLAAEYPGKLSIVMSEI